MHVNCRAQLPLALLAMLPRSDEEAMNQCGQCERKSVTRYSIPDQVCSLPAQPVA